MRQCANSVLIATKNSLSCRALGRRIWIASLLMLPLVGFLLQPEDARVRGTLAAIERELVVDGLVQRYDTEAGKDGLPPGEGTFLACSFWLADNLVLQDRVAEAGELFERLLALRNDVGLLAEECSRTPVFVGRSATFHRRFPTWHWWGQR